IDIGCKAYTVHRIGSREYPLFKGWCGIDCSLQYVKNTGAAWGAFSEFQEYLLGVRFLAIGALLLYLYFSRVTFLQKSFLALVTTGAVGNVIDFFLYGHVVDMFHFCFWGYSFAVFNIADSMIFCGTSLLLLQNLMMRKQRENRETIL
ncbi:MAG: signal peptidase II, partial [Chlamydiae bacterium]|nr:signal peptidase II [Chlamydiota bacterium]